MSAAGLVEVEVRGVRPALAEALPVAAVVCRRGASDQQGLCITIGAGDAHALQHELQGQETPRSQAVCVAGQVAMALGGRVAAARLLCDGPARLTGALELATSHGSVSVPATPGQALSAAVCLGVPLLADAALFPAPLPSTVALEGPIATFLDSLDVSALEQGPE